MPITFDKVNKWIVITIPDTEVTIQELINAIRDYEDELVNLDIPKIADCSGKEELGGGVYVGLTLKLIDWKLKFEDRPGPDYVVCNVRGGNLVAYDTTLEEYVNPIQPASYVTVTLTSSSSATLQELQLTDLKYRLESLRDTHPAFGDTIYWDPINGDDDNSGVEIDSAVKTFSRALELVQNNHNDLIIGYAEGEVTITEPININKNAVHIKSTGSGIWKWNTPGQTAITISGNQCSIEAFAIENADKGIVITGDNPDIQDFVIRNTTNEGIIYDGVSNGQLRNGIIYNCGSDGVLFKNSSRGIRLFRVASKANSGDGFKIESGCAGIVFMTDTNATANSGYGINIQSGAISTAIFGTVLVDENTAGDINDNGTGTIIQSFATEGEGGATAEQVWLEKTNKYQTKPGTMGYRLKHLSGAFTKKIIQKGVWTKKEKEQLIKGVNKLLAKIDETRKDETIKEKERQELTKEFNKLKQVLEKIKGEPVKPVKIPDYSEVLQKILKTTTDLKREKEGERIAFISRLQELDNKVKKVEERAVVLDTKKEIKEIKTDMQEMIKLIVKALPSDKLEEMVKACEKT